jgi:hypothetical protein
VTLRKDKNGYGIQGFASKEIVSITGDAAWTPDSSHVAFRVSEECNYSIDGGSDEATLLAGSITVIHPGITTITFDTTMNIEVM